MIRKCLLLIVLCITFAINANADDLLINDKIKRAAYEEAKDEILPMNTEQIMNFLKSFSESQEASVKGQSVHPEKRARIETVPLDPGEIIPTVYVAQGFVSTVSFLDATGYGWPVIDVVSGGDFTITPPEENGHIIRITPHVRFGYGNLSVRLKGLEFPVTLNIEVDDKFVDYRFDAKIPLSGPNSEVSIIKNSNIKSAGNPMLSSVLEGIIPSDFKKLEIISGDVEGTSIYQKNGMLYIRTNATLLSPRWEASASVSEGLKVYIAKPSSVLLFSKNGDVEKVKIKLLKEDI